MINVLLNNLERDEKGNERIDAFARTLNDAFKHFQKLWDDHIELLKKYKESESKSSNVKNVENPATDNNVYTAAVKENVMIPEKESVGIAEKKKVDCDFLTGKINEPEESTKLDFDQNFQIFSQDFYTQGLEESFVNQSKNVFQEIQNITPKRSKSPILGSKKGKTPRPPSSPVSSRNLSQKSVVILNDSPGDRSSKIVNRSVSSPLLQSNDNTASAKTINPILLSSPACVAEVTPPPKNIRKWGISTVHNVNTDVIVGTNKKLKQARLFIKTEKLTDLSSYNDISVKKSDNQDQAIKKHDIINTNFTQTNNNCLEDSVIQGSPESENSGSKICQRKGRRDKTADISKRKLTTKDVKDIIDAEKLGSTNNDVNLTDTDMTIFDPRVASTQNTHLPSCSKVLQIEKSLRYKSVFEEEFEPENERVDDSNVIDETMFVKDVVPTSGWPEKELNYERIVKKKKLSLKKTVTADRNPERILRDERNSGLEMKVSVDGSSSHEPKRVSPPRKKFALSNFDVPTKKKNKSPTYAYKGSPVRKQAERALLNGWSCLDCQKYYEAIGLSEEELQKRKNICSRHRSKFNPKKVSQQAYWDPDFSSSYHSTMWSED